MFTISSFSGCDKTSASRVDRGKRANCYPEVFLKNFEAGAKYCNFETTPLVFLVYFSLVRMVWDALFREKFVLKKRKLSLFLSILDEKLGNRGFFSELDERKSTCDILVIKCSASFFIINMSSSTSYDV